MNTVTTLEKENSIRGLPEETRLEELAIKSSIIPNIVTYATGAVIEILICESIPWGVDLFDNMPRRLSLTKLWNLSEDGLELNKTQAEYVIKNENPIGGLSEINTETTEGRLLMAALSVITTESRKDKTPYQVLRYLNRLQKVMFKK